MILKQLTTAKNSYSLLHFLQVIAADWDLPYYTPMFQEHIFSVGLEDVSVTLQSCLLEGDALFSGILLVYQIFLLPFLYLFLKSYVPPYFDINENLEQQAQAIYRSMFVTMHHDSDRMGLLSELITVKYGKDHKKLNDGIYPVYGSGGIMRYVESPLYDKESVLIPRKGSLNNVMYVNEPFWSVDTMFYTEMKQPNIAKFVFHFVKSKDLASLNAGSAVPSMTTDILNSMELRIPSADRLAEFEGLVAPLYRAVEDNTRQSSRLSALRDTLLPKLMNGEIDVSEVKI